MHNRVMKIEHPLSQFLFCPKCGSGHFEINDCKSKKCTKCGFEYYFNVSAAVAALILNSKNELLICKRARDPAKGTLDLPGGFVDLEESIEEAIARELKEETGMQITQTSYLFSLPNIYVYSDFQVHTIDLFFRCEVENTEHFTAMDDVTSASFIPLNQIHPEDFGLESIKKGMSKFLKEY